MFVVYIAFGIISGLVAATIALLSGFGIFTAFIAYALAGIAGMVVGLIWASVPKQNVAAKHPATQRS